MDRWTDRQVVMQKEEALRSKRYCHDVLGVLGVLGAAVLLPVNEMNLMFAVTL
jgi:hypothetical protein